MDTLPAGPGCRRLTGHSVVLGTGSWGTLRCHKEPVAFWPPEQNWSQSQLEGAGKRGLLGASLGDPALSSEAGIPTWCAEGQVYGRDVSLCAGFHLPGLYVGLPAPWREIPFLERDRWIHVCPPGRLGTPSGPWLFRVSDEAGTAPTARVCCEY